MKKIKLPALLLGCLVSCFFTKNAYASHVAGGEMSYTYLGKNRYLITACLYRDCRGIAFSGPTFGVYGGVKGGNGCGSYSLSCTRISIKDITPRCSVTSSPCSPANTYGTGEGVELHTYIDTVDFNKSPLSNYVNKSSCCEVTFYFGQCCRTGAITTGSAGDDFWVTCTINICNLAKCKNTNSSSPQWTKYNNFFVCCNQAFRTYGGATDDVDHDSITYQLTNGISSIPSTSIGYSSPFTSQYPATPWCNPPTTIKCTPSPDYDPPKGFYFDTSHAEIVFTPTKCDEVAVLVYEIHEYRKDTTGKYILIGKCKRDVLINIRDDCSYNKAPKLTFGSKIANICEGDTLKMQIIAEDKKYAPYQSKVDSIITTFDNSKTGSQLKVIMDTAKWIKTFRFVLPTKKGDALETYRDYWFNVFDQNCPRSENISDFISVKILKKPDSFYLKSALTICNDFSATAYAPGIESKVNFIWTLTDSATGKTIKSGTGKTINSATLTKGTYKLKLDLKSIDYCPMSIEKYFPVKSNFNPLLSIGTDTTICKGSDVTLKLQNPPVSGPLSYYWSVNSSHNSDDTLSILALTDINSNANINLKVTDVYKCIYNASRNIIVAPIPTVSIDSFHSICPGDLITLDAGHKDTMQYLWSTGEKTQKIVVKNKGKYYVKVTNAKTGCFGTDTGQIAVKILPVVTVTKDSFLCENIALHDLNKLILVDSKTPASGYFTYKIGAFNGDTANAKVSSTTLTNGFQMPGSAGLGTWSIRYKGISQSCSFTGQFNAQIVPAPAVDFSFSPDPVTNATKVFNLINSSSISDASALKYLWHLGQGSSDTSIAKAPQINLPDRSVSYNITLKATSIHGCTNSIQKTLVNYVVSDKILLPDEIKMTEDLIFLSRELQSVQCKIYDLNGKLVLEFNNNDGLKKNSMNRLQQGLFLYRIVLKTMDGKEFFITGKTLVAD